ncbi:glycosyltransferase [Janthinobacterium svalbardensis]|uniref:glycosyltransferase n=1 Tax=Janthinobacterium svalbardensis TaxID=368607 RepID=UPI002FCDCF81
MVKASCAVDSKNKIHVLQIVCDPVGGIRKHVHNLICEIEPSIVTQSYVYSDINVDARFVEERENVREKLSQMFTLKIRKKPHYSDLVNLYKLIRFVKKEKVTIVHGHGAKAGVYARLVASICNIKSVYTPHGGVVHAMFSKFEDLVYINVERLLSRLTDLYIFESQYTADSFQRKIKKLDGNWIVNYNGIEDVNVEAARKNSIGLDYSYDESTIHVGIFGSLRPEKGQIFALRAAALLLKKGRKIFFHFYGSGSDLEVLQAEAHVLGIDEFVRFHGDVSDVFGHMLLIDVVLVPSLFESFGYVAVEAMACGKAIIATKVGGLPEVVSGECGLLVSAGNVDEIVEKIEVCIDRPEETNKRIHDARNRFLMKFHVAGMVSEIKNQYSRLAANRV